MEGYELDFPWSLTRGLNRQHSGGWLWRDTHYVSGSRPTALATVSAVDLTVEVDASSLSCDNDIFEVVIEGVTMGTFEVYWVTPVPVRRSSQVSPSRSSAMSISSTRLRRLLTMGVARCPSAPQTR